jgi:hypothetical protein
MLIDAASQFVLTVKPAIPTIWSALLAFQLGYVGVSKVYRPRNRAIIMAARICRTAFGLFLLWLFLKQFIFVGMNMQRFEDSAWLPLIEALFR